MQSVGTADNLEARVRRVKRPRTGKLLSRQYPRISEFYAEFVTASDDFKTALKSYLNSKRGNLAALKPAARICIDSERRFSELQHLRLWQYSAIVNHVNNNGGRWEGPEAVPDEVTGFYTGMLLAWYFDRVNAETRELKSPMLTAAGLLLQELKKADAGIAAKVNGTDAEKRAAYCTARDLLTARKGFIPLGVLRNYETAVLNSLGLGYLTSEQQEQVIPQMREAFRSADKANLALSLEAKLASFARETKKSSPNRGNPKNYWCKNGFTPPGADYFEGDIIMHQVYGPGIVVRSPADVVTAWNRPASEYEIVVALDKQIEGRETNLIRLIVNPKNQVSV